MSGSLLIGRQATQEKPGPGGAGPSRWRGTIVRGSKDQSTLDVRKGTITKTIYYDSSTKWTEAQGKKPAEMSAFTEGSEVICLGRYDEKGRFVATQIDLRTQEQKP
jgi:hypothetical protein